VPSTVGENLPPPKPCVTEPPDRQTPGAAPLLLSSSRQNPVSDFLACVKCHGRFDCGQSFHQDPVAGRVACVYCWFGGGWFFHLETVAVGPVCVKCRTTRFLCFRRFWQAGTLWQPVCLSSNPPPSFRRAAFFVLCGTRAGGRPPRPARPGFFLALSPPGLVAGGRAGVYLTRGAGGDTGGG
jgi:hypothetical protein